MNIKYYAEVLARDLIIPYIIYKLLRAEFSFILIRVLCEAL